MCCVILSTSPSECGIHMPTCRPAVTLVHYTCWSIMFFYIFHIYLVFSNVLTIYAISVHNMYCCFHAMYVIWHATDISWSPPADIELNPVPALNGLRSNICSGTLSWFVSWFPLGLHKIVTRRGDWRMCGLHIMISTVLTDCKYCQVQQWWTV
jgi:hypothetical protein